jgi:hypothetical protein
MSFNKSKTELIGNLLELQNELTELHKDVKLLKFQNQNLIQVAQFYRKKFTQSSEFGGAEEYISGEVDINKLVTVLGNDKKLN